MSRSDFLFCMVFMLCLIVLVPSTNATTIHVPVDQPTIAAGLAVAAPGDTVLVAPGLFLEHDLVMRAGVCLRGATGEPADVVVDAQQQGRVVTCVDVDELVRIEALTFTGGLATMETIG